MSTTDETRAQRGKRIRELACQIVKQASTLECASRQAWGTRPVEYQVAHETMYDLRLLTVDDDVMYPKYDGPASEHERLADTFGSFTAQSVANDVRNGTLMGVRLVPVYDVAPGELHLKIGVSA